MFKDKETVRQELYCARNQLKPLKSLFKPLKANGLVHSMPRELKLVSLELSGYEDSEYAIKIVLPCL
jgi:hypothetical protein